MRKYKTIQQQDKYYGFDFVAQLENTLICGNHSVARKMFLELSRTERKKAYQLIEDEYCRNFYFNLL